MSRKPRYYPIVILEIEDEFNSPFLSIIESFIEGGYTMRFTAESLEINYLVLRKICRHFGLIKLFDKNKRMSTKPTEETKQLQKEANIRKFGFVYNGIKDTLSGHAERHGVKYKTAKNRLYRGYPLEDVFYPGHLNEKYPPRANDEALKRKPQDGAVS